MALSTGHPVFIRIGIHVGEVIVEAHEDPNRPNDLYGIHLDTSSRIMSLAQADQILMSRFVFDNARPVIRGQDLEGVGELSFMNHGPYRFKGVEEPAEVCEIGETAKALLRQPPNSEKAERYVSAEMEPVLGWRPALNQRVPDSEWVLEEKLGEGGFGEVWLGRHETLHEKGVFKFCFRKDRVRALRQQVRIFKVLGHHPNIVSVRGVYFEHAPYYIMMDFVEGWDLSSWCKAEGGIEKIPLTTRLEVVAQIADALQAAHDKEVIHRDVKPSNILISKPSTRSFELKAMLTDFGVGQVVSNEALAKVTRLGFTQAMMLPGSSSGGGTQMFMAPELLAGKSATKPSDIYSLGVVLYQLLVEDLSRPLTIDWAKEIHDPLLRDDLAHCFAGNPQERFASAGQLAINLRSLEKRRALKRRATYRRALSVAATLALLVVIVFAAKKWRGNKLWRDTHITIATEKLRADNASSALAHLALVTRKFPYNRQAAQLLIETLTHRNFALPITGPLLHGDSVRGVEFSPDERFVVTGSNDKTARVWDAVNGEPTYPPLRHDGRVTPSSSVQTGNGS